MPRKTIASARQAPRFSSSGGEGAAALRGAARAQHCPQDRTAEPRSAPGGAQVSQGNRLRPAMAGGMDLWNSEATSGRGQRKLGKTKRWPGLACDRQEWIYPVKHLTGAGGDGAEHRTMVDRPSP